jgi:hypothetical protein
LDSVQKAFTGFTLIVVPQEPVTEINNPFEADEGFAIYPNPTTGPFTVKGLEGNARLYDLYGKLIMASKNSAWNITGLSNGIYFLKLKDEKGRVAIQKLVKK